MKRQRSHGEKTTTADHAAAAAATGKSARKMMRSKVVGPDHNKDGGVATGSINTATATATATLGICAAAAAAAAVPAVEREYYMCNGGEADHQGGGVLNYEQMWWSSIWLPSFDVDNYMVAAADDAEDETGGGGVVWDIDDIWNLKSIKK